MELTLAERVELLEELVCTLYENQADGYYKYRADRGAFIRELEDRKARNGHKQH